MLDLNELIHCYGCGKDIPGGEFYRTHVSCPVGATEGRPAGFASSSGSASAAPDIKATPVAAEPAVNPKPSNTVKEGEPLDLSRAVQLPVSGSGGRSQWQNGWTAGVLFASKRVADHWNDQTTVVNQREQAIRSSHVLKRLATSPPDAPSGAGASGGS